MSPIGRIFWLLCIWIPPLICFEEFCSGTEVKPMKAWDDFNDAFTSRFPRKEPTIKEES